MKIKTARRRFITLVEIMIVMILIALITGVLAVNFRGSLDEGKVFKTKVGMEKLAAVLDLAVAKDPKIAESVSDPNVWQDLVRKSALVQNPNDLIKDGWGEEYKVEVEEGRIKITSPGLENYEKRKSG